MNLKKRLNVLRSDVWKNTSNSYSHSIILFYWISNSVCVAVGFLMDGDPLYDIFLT